MKILEVKPIRDKILQNLKKNIIDYKTKYKSSPKLAIILVGDNKASQLYIKTKEKMAAEVGIETENYFFDKKANPKDVASAITKLNNDENANGILLQLPVPEGMDTFALLEKISPLKDVDGLTSLNMGYLLKDKQNVLACTPLGILKIFEHHNIQLKSKNVLIINRSDIVGKPLASALLHKGTDATVMVAHSMTKNIKELAQNADIVVSAVGRDRYIDSSWKLKNDAIVIDVSINRVDDSSSPKGYRVTGDFVPEDFQKTDISYTPVPGGVGLMTVCELLENTLLLAKKQQENK